MRTIDREADPKIKPRRGGADTKRKNAYVKMGLTMFLTVGAILLGYDTLFGHRVLVALFTKLMTAVAPVLYGAMMAYLLSPVVNFFETLLFSNAKGRLWKRGTFPAVGARSVSILMTWVLVCAFLYVLASVLLPEVYKSILQLGGNLENYYNTIYGWMEHLLETNPDLEHWAMEQMNVSYQNMNTWLRDTLLPQAQQLMSAVSGGVVSVLVFLKNLLVGIIVSVYLMATKELCGAQARKIVYSVTNRTNASWIVRGVHKADDIFSGFVRGKLLDSLIIGILCFVGCSLFKFPYTPLVSVFVGVTNVIPFFGPFLGAIPSTILILLASPRKALYFVLFVLALQQLDGNVIGPKILGDKTGLSSLGVIVAILVGGSFFGVAGMFFGVPVFACANCLITFLVESRLRRREMPVSVAAYASDIPAADPPGEQEKEMPKSERENGNNP